MKPEDRKDPHRILLEEGSVIDEALKKGVRDALLRHKRAGLPVVVYQDGNTIWIDPKDLDLD